MENILKMSASNSSFAGPSPLDLYYISTSSKVFFYGFISILIVGSIGNTFQIITFTRKTMRNVSTGVLFLALSISDTIYLLLSIYNLITFGFQIPDRSDYIRACQIRHFSSYLATNFSAWMLTLSKLFKLENVQEISVSHSSCLRSLVTLAIS